MGGGCGKYIFVHIELFGGEMGWGLWLGGELGNDSQVGELCRWKVVRVIICVMESC